MPYWIFFLVWFFNVLPVAWYLSDVIKITDLGYSPGEATAIVMLWPLFVVFVILTRFVKLVCKVVSHAWGWF
jgi:hypothetical protein